MKKISTRICLVFAIIMVLAVTVISCSLMYIFGQKIYTHIVDSQKVLMEQNKVNVENMLNSLNQVCVFLTSDNAIADILNDDSEDTLVQYTNKGRLFQEFLRYVNGPLSDLLSTYSTVLYVNDNFNVAEGLESQPLEEERNRLNAIYGIDAVQNSEWFQKTMEKRGGIYTFTRENDDESVYIARLVRNIHLDTSDQIVGVMVVELPRERFAKQVEISQLTPNTEVYIIEEEAGTILYSSKNTERNYVTLRNYLETSGENKREIVELDGRKYVVMHYTTYWDWCIISFIPLSDISSELWHTLTAALMITAVCVIICIAIMYQIAQSVSRPLVELSELMQEIQENGEIETAVVPLICCEDEVGKLYKSFSNLIEKIRELLQQQYESGIRQKETELVALQAQINPHFIYNVMDSINWLSLCDGNDDLAEMASALAAIMRYSIKNPYEHVTLQDEFIHVENFLRIQKHQSSMPIQIIKRISDEHLGLKMPKFLIEPLVENSIIHGFCKEQEGAKIIITSAKEDNCLLITITDNGIGADVNILNKYIAGEISGIAHSDGFGIKNVNERIQLMYSDDFGLHYSSNPDRGITARISLPWKE